ncbi:hypothetical protein FOCC_FOCC004010 [Frankliniella occidentalis]|nr:hypothetical protein FOCC_FOCC004010 [Frankliniella occidentalis]
MPVRLMGIHFINSVPLVQHIVNLVKPLMKKELIEIFHVHTIEDMPKFYERYVSQTSMPEEYGGKGKSCPAMHAEVRRRIEDHKEYLHTLDALLVDETKRAGKSKNSSDVFGIQGSFKKLDLD